MGGMAPFIPTRKNPEVNEKALAQTRADKEREAGDGHDGTWVAHPGLVPVAAEVFDRLMPAPNQIARTLDDVRVGADGDRALSTRKARQRGRRGAHPTGKVRRRPPAPARVRPHHRQQQLQRRNAAPRAGEIAWTLHRRRRR